MKSRSVLVIVLSFTIATAKGQEFLCYGQDIDTRCNVGEVLLPEGVSAVSMSKTINCSVLPPSPGGSCCTPVSCPDEDSCCIGPYRNASFPERSFVYHERCIGRDQCEPEYIGGMDVSLLGCNSSAYNEQTTMLIIMFQCISDTIGVMSQESVTIETHNQTSNENSTSLHLWMDYYNNSSPVIIDNNCSIQTDSCDENIDIDLIDVRLTSETVVIGNDNEQLVLTKDDNNNFVRSSRHFSSQKHNLTVRVFNSGDVQSSYLWITFHATSNLTLRCPAVPSTLVCPQNAISVCDDRFSVTCHSYRILTVVVCMIVVFVFLIIMVLFVVRFRIFHPCVKSSKQPSGEEKYNNSRSKHYPRDVEGIVKFIVKDFQERQHRKSDKF